MIYETSPDCRVDAHNLSTHIDHPASVGTVLSSFSSQDNIPASVTSPTRHIQGPQFGTPFDPSSIFNA